MATTNSSNDDATGRRLRLLIGLVVVLALGTAALTLWYADRHPQPAPDLITLLLLCAAVVVANRVLLLVRVRADWHGTTWSEVPVLVGLALAPAPWVMLCAGLGVAILKTATRVAPHKIVFGAAKEVITVATAGAVLAALRPAADAGEPWLYLGVVAVAFVAMAISDDLVFVPVIALASGTPVRQLIRTDWDIKLLGQLVRLAMTLLVVGILAFGGNILTLLVVPPTVICVHLWHSHRLRTREERRSWQRLAQTIDELNAVELGALLHSAVTRAALIFSADDAEVELRSGGSPRLIRGTADDITYDGDPADATALPGTTVPSELVAHDGSYRVGVLRLHFRGRVTLNEFEQYKLKTFASALCTAIRNATAYAELERIARVNAHAAMHDPLTGLPNRRALLDRGDDVLGHRPGDGMTALLLIDLNHFKEVNDTLGHTAGDLVLTEVAARLQDASRPGELVARLGGDEFAVMLTGLPTPAMAQHRAEQLLASMDRTIEVDGMHLTIEACGGIALAPGTGGVTELLRRADVAMYQAKRAGQRTANYAHARDTADVSRLMLGGELSRAVAEHEFIVDFQPIVDLGSGEVVSAEALARWHHPHHGNLNPMRFLETVERSGKLPAFAGAVLEQSLTAAVAWREAGFDLPVAVNVSPRSLLDPEFPGSVLDRLTRHGVPADRLVLELTETLTISQLEVVDRALGELRRAGVRLALDDFGTGVSSLALLSRVRVHELKIDRDFVTAVETSPEAAAVIRSTVDLARSLHLTVVAEGVESEPQRHALWELGCVAGQGHLFARPMSSARMLAALRRGTGGRPGTLASALHDAGSVVRLPRKGRSGGRGRSSLPHLPA